MGITDKDVNWQVWGSNSSSGSGSSSSSSVGAYSSSSQSGSNSQSSACSTNQQTEEEAAESQQQSCQQNGIKARIKSAVLLPDCSTDFNKECKFKVEIESKEGYSAPVQVSLWGKYENTEHNLNCETTATPVNMVAEGQVTLFYIDPYYDDVFGNGKTDATADYFLKVTMKNASDFTGSPLTLPKGAAKKSISIKFVNDSEEGSAIANAKCTINIGSSPMDVSTDGEGVLIFDIEDGATEGKICIEIADGNVIELPIQIEI